MIIISNPSPVISRNHDTYITRGGVFMYIFTYFIWGGVILFIILTLYIDLIYYSYYTYYILFFFIFNTI